MALRFKQGVRVRNLRVQILLALRVAENVYEERNFDCVVTSAADSKHSRASRHYDGAAVDLRTNNTGGAGKAIADEIRARLAPLEDYDVLFEGDGTPNEHIHVEWQPKF